MQRKSPSSNKENTSKNNSINKKNKNINYHIKYQNKPKNTNTPIINSKNNTNNNSHNLNSNIILINNNNINYSNKNETNENIMNDSKNQNNELNKESISNGDILYKNKFKNLLISNISTLTNNISNILSNNDPNANNVNINDKKNNPYLNSKINEYCYKNKIITNSSNDETYSKGKISTNYNNDLEINISDIKFSKTKKENKNKYQVNKSETDKIKKLKYNDSYYKLSENNVIKKEENNTITNNNEEEIKEVLNLKLDTEKNQKEELNDSEYKIYEANNINNKSIKKTNLSMNYFTNSENKKGKINDFLDANIWLENENGKEQKINLDDYINKAKEKLSKIRNNNIEEKNILNKKRIKSTFNYILNKNNKNNNDITTEYDLDIKNKNEKEKLNNIKGNLIKNKSNKYIIKTSNRMQNFLNVNLNEFQKNKVVIKKLSKSKINDNIPNIKKITEEKIEVFDEEEFMQIKRRNLSTKKNKIKINLDADFKKLNRSNKKYRNINKEINNENIGNKTLNENILPPNNLNIKPILNQNIVKTILKSKVNF